MEVLNSVNSKKRELEIYLSKLNTQVEKLAQLLVMEKIFNDFDFSFKNAANELRKLKNFDDVATGLKNIYEKQAKDYSEYTITFSETTRLMQHFYLNSQAAEVDKTLSSYAKIHKIYHPVLKIFQENIQLFNL